MANIEVVIKIPEEIRLALINNVQLSIDQQSICDSCVKQAIVNGTPLPKGLISINDVMSVFDDFMCGDVDENDIETFYEMLKEKVVGADEDRD